MAQQINRLTARSVSTATKPGLIPDGGGLYLQVTKGGAKSWLYRFMLNGKRRDMGLGSLQTTTLADAREIAADARKTVASGIDPIDEREKRRTSEALAAGQGKSFQDCAEEYIRINSDGWKNAKHRQQWTNTLRNYVYPVIGQLHVKDITKQNLLQILEPIWQDKTETARRVRSRIEAVLDMAIAADLRQAENPARLAILKHLLPNKGRGPKVVHHSALSYAQIGEFMGDLRGRDGVAPIALQFIILTATRTSEAINAKWDEVDLDKRIWTIPAERMKAGREHRVPLTDAAVTLLKHVSRIGGNEHVFPGLKRGKPLSNMACLVLLRRMERGDLTVHGFRSTFRDWAAEQTAFPREVAEMALAHTLKDKVEAAYRRGDLFEKRRRMMEEWADYCATDNR